MPISKVPLILVIAAVLVLAAGCSVGDAVSEALDDSIESNWEWLPENIKSHKVKEGSIKVQLTCCESESTMVGDLSVASVVVENTTERRLRNFKFKVGFQGRDGFVLPEVETDGELDLATGQKARLKLFLYDAETKQYIDPKDIDNNDDAGGGLHTASVSFD